MKTFLHKHKIVLIALLCVLGFGIVSGLAIGGTIRLSMQNERFETVADATAHTETNAPDASAPLPSEAVKTPVKLSANGIARILATVNTRRRYAVPTLSNRMDNSDQLLFEQSIWKLRMADDGERTVALRVTEDLLDRIFAQPFEALTGVAVQEAEVSVLTDSEGRRASLIRVSDAGGILEVTLCAMDYALVNVDLLVYPEYESVDEAKEISRICERLGTFGTIRSIERHDTNRETLESIYYVETDGECLAFSYFGDRLSQASVYPNRDAMLEGVVFLADLQSLGGESAYPERFVEAEAPKRIGKLNNPQQRIQTRIERLFTVLEHIEPKDVDTEVTFYKDESGAREDIWRVEGKRIHAVISAYSGNIIEMTCEISCKDLSGIPYDEMGGDAYVSVTEWIGRLIASLAQMTGQSQTRQMTSASVNAVYEDHFCSMEITMSDETYYECVFEDGVLREIRYYADETFLFFGTYGWVADQVRIHPYTDRLYIPYYRAWDGDLHIRKAAD